MRKRDYVLLGAMVLALLVVSSPTAYAQRTDNDSVTVTATNNGLFACTYPVTSFDFGQVDANGTLDTSVSNVTSLGRNSADNGAQYETTGAPITWTCVAAPQSTVTIALTSAAADHTLGGMADDDLQIRIPDAGGGTSSGYQVFTSLADLITGMTVRNGTGAVNGQLDLRLTVLDADPVGANSWTVNLRATGTP